MKHYFPLALPPSKAHHRTFRPRGRQLTHMRDTAINLRIDIRASRAAQNNAIRSLATGQQIGNPRVRTLQVSRCSIADRVVLTAVAVPAIEERVAAAA